MWVRAPSGPAWPKTYLGPTSRTLCRPAYISCAATTPMPRLPWHASGDVTKAARWDACSPLARAGCWSGRTRCLLLRNTAAEVMHDLACYNGAYVHYLLSVYVPLALARDPTFGLAIDTLAAAIRQRLSHDGDPALHAVCESTLRDLGGTA